MRAGGVTPATPFLDEDGGELDLSPFNEGRGGYPGDARHRFAFTERPAAFNEGRGGYPGDAACTAVERHEGPTSFNEGRGGYPGDAALAAGAFGHFIPFNEGRGGYPGDAEWAGPYAPFDDNVQ